MNIRPAVIFLSSALLALSAAAYGQPQGPEREKGEKEPEMLSERYLEMLDKRLGLKEEQKKKVEAVINDAKPSLKKNFEEMKGLREKMKALGEKIQKQMRAAQESIRGALDSEQKEKFDEMRVRMRQRQKQRMSPRRRRGGGGGGVSPVQPGGFPGEDMGFPGEEGPDRFPPERLEGEPWGGRDDLPPEIRERIIERRKMRRGMEPGSQRDVPPSGEWNDRKRGLFNPDEPRPRPDDAD